jgi:hypothetical protein
MAAPAVQLWQRNLAEIARSAAEASKASYAAAGIGRYMSPPAPNRV